MPTRHGGSLAAQAILPPTQSGSETRSLEISSSIPSPGVKRAGATSWHPRGPMSSVSADQKPPPSSGARAWHRTSARGV